MTATMVSSLTIVGVLLVVLAILRLRHLSLQNLALGLIGAILGLLIGALASVPLSKLPEPFGGILPVTLSIIITIGMIAIVVSRRSSLLRLAPFLSLQNDGAEAGPKPPLERAGAGRALVDTSVIIDGRIADIAAVGFAPSVLVVPRFVLAELQNIADSDDAMRRGRGRRGLEVLNRLRELPDVTVEITEEDVPNIREVDAKLVALAQRFSCNVLTTDYNLNRVAQIQGVRVLNVNELSNAIRPVVLPGEELVVRVVQPGKERNQGVGYLADGTMIVVENGDKLIGQEVATEVTRVFQTVAGKMIFATPRKPVGNGQASHGPAPEPYQASSAEPAAVTPAMPEPPATAPDPASNHRPDRARGRHRPHQNGNGTKKADAGTADHQAAARPEAPAAHSETPAVRPQRQRLRGSDALEDRIVRQNQSQPPSAPRPGRDDRPAGPSAQ